MVYPSVAGVGVGLLTLHSPVLVPQLLPVQPTRELSALSLSLHQWSPESVSQPLVSTGETPTK